jgi:hypothetical protein
MQELGETVFGIRDPTATHDCSAISVVRLPERNLIDPVSLFHHPIAEVERLEHLHRPTGDAIGLAERESAGLLLNDEGVVSGKTANCAASVRPVGPQPTIRTSTSLARPFDNDRDACRSAGSEIAGSPDLNPSRWNCMASQVQSRLIRSLAYHRERVKRAAPRTPTATLICSRRATQTAEAPLTWRRRATFIGAEEAG